MIDEMKRVAFVISEESDAYPLCVYSDVLTALEDLSDLGQQVVSLFVNEWRDIKVTNSFNQRSFSYNGHNFARSHDDTADFYGVLGENEPGFSNVASAIFSFLLKRVIKNQKIESDLAEVLEFRRSMNDAVDSVRRTEKPKRSWSWTRIVEPSTWRMS